MIIRALLITESEGDDDHGDAVADQVPHQLGVPTRVDVGQLVWLKTMYEVPGNSQDIDIYSSMPEHLFNWHRPSHFHSH